MINTQQNTRSQVEYSQPQLNVMAATLSLFSTKGYFSTSVRDISRESGVSIGSIYHHFKHKEGVAHALYAHLVGRMLFEFEEFNRGYTSAHDRCRAVMERLFELTESEPEVMAFMLYSKHREYLPNANPVCSSEPFVMMRDMVQEGMAAGEIKEIDLMVASSCLFGGAIRMITSRLDGLIEKPLMEYLDSMWECSWKSVAIQ